LACAALLPKRVIAACSIAGVAPWEAEGLDWLAGTGKENVEEFNAALEGPTKLRLHLERVAPEFAKITRDQIIAAHGDMTDDADKAALSGELGAYEAENLRDALSKGFYGWLDDDLALIHEWGLDLRAISAPVCIWHGAEDRAVSTAHSRWLAEHIPGAISHIVPRQGHLSLAVNCFGQILDELMANGDG
jgi:pimeloyl-ACP methyl ester carboxylesterase